MDNYDKFKLETPPDNGAFESEPCACCLEANVETFVLGIESYGLKADAIVCGFCLSELHNNLTLNN